MLNDNQRADIDGFVNQVLDDIEFNKLSGKRESGKIKLNVKRTGIDKSLGERSIHTPPPPDRNDGLYVELLDPFGHLWLRFLLNDLFDKNDRQVMREIALYISAQIKNRLIANSRGFRGKIPVIGK